MSLTQTSFSEILRDRQKKIIILYHMIEKILYILFAVLHIHIKIPVYNRKCYKITILRKRKAWIDISWGRNKTKDVAI